MKNFSKLIKESVTAEINNMLNDYYQQSLLNERLGDKMSAHWDNAKTMVGNVGRGLTGQTTKTMVDANQYSQAKDQQRTNKKDNKKLLKIQSTVNTRFNQKIAPLLQRYGVDANSVLQTMNNAIANNMKNVTNPNMENYRKPKDGGQQQGQEQTNNTNQPVQQIGGQQQTVTNQETQQQTTVNKPVETTNMGGQQTQQQNNGQQKSSNPQSAVVNQQQQTTNSGGQNKVQPTNKKKKVVKQQQQSTPANQQSVVTNPQNPVSTNNTVKGKKIQSQQ